MAEGGHVRYCPQCGQKVSPGDRFCNNCGYSLSVPPPGEGRITTERVHVPPPPARATPAQGGLGGFLRSFRLGKGALIGMAVALTLLLALLVAGGVVLFIGIGGKQEATGEASLHDLIQNQVGDYTLQTNEPYKLSPKQAAEATPESRRVTYESSEGDEVNHVVGILTPRYAYSAQTEESKRFIDGFLEGGAKDASVGGDPKRSEFAVTDASGKQVGRGILLQGTDSDALFWVNERLSAAVKAPAGEGQNFYDELPY
jgi:hypothetical protein